MQTVKIRPREGEYPKTDIFLAEPTDGIKFAVDGKLLKTIVDYVTKAMKDSVSCPIVFHVVDSSSPIRFSFELLNGQKGVGAIMPVRL